MGIRNRIKSFGKGKIQDKCERNPDSGEIHCTRTRINPDGTAQDVAGFTMSADASCNALATSSYENEEGALEDLERKFVPRIISKCKNTPADY